MIVCIVFNMQHSNHKTWKWCIWKWYKNLFSYLSNSSDSYKSHSKYTYLLSLAIKQLDTWKKILSSQCTHLKFKLRLSVDGNLRHLILSVDFLKTVISFELFQVRRLNSRIILSVNTPITYCFSEKHGISTTCFIVNANPKKRILLTVIWDTGLPVFSNVFC